MMFIGFVIKWVTRGVPEDHPHGSMWLQRNLVDAWRDDLSSSQVIICSCVSVASS